MEFVVQTKDLCKAFAGKNAVNRVNINIRRGDIYGFIGENGAGKTTFMRMLCGLAKPTGGTMRLFESTDLERQRKRIIVGLCYLAVGIIVGSVLFKKIDIQ